jgi:hypothetical protein
MNTSQWTVVSGQWSDCTGSALVGSSAKGSALSGPVSSGKCFSHQFLASS